MLQVVLCVHARCAQPRASPHVIDERNNEVECVRTNRTSEARCDLCIHVYIFVYVFHEEIYTYIYIYIYTQTAPQRRGARTNKTSSSLL